MKYQKKKITYSHIDEVFEKAADLKNKARSKISRFENEQSLIFKKQICALLIVTIIIFAILYFVSKYNEGFDLFFPIATTIILVLSVIISSSITTSYCSKIAEHKEGVITKCKTDVLKLYYELFYNKNVYSLLDIPHDISFGEDNLPISTSTNFIRYTSRTGNTIHKQCGCSGAYNTNHLFTLTKNGYRPCSRCAMSDRDFTVPQWFKYYFKLKELDEKYGLKMKFEPFNMRNIRW